MIRLENVTVNFGRGAAAITAARDVSFAVSVGEAFGLVGESGSGKSTVLRAIAGLIPHVKGRIVLGGQEMQASRSKAVRKMAQMVFQDPYGSLHPNQTIDRTLRMPVAIHRLGDADDRIDAMLGEVGLKAEHRFRYPHQLSGGQRQRVAIARALILEPAILLLDEPTSALDVSVQAEILNLLVRLQRDRNLTVLMVSHDLAVIAHLCDRIAVMSHGSVVEMTNADGLASGQVVHPYTRELLRSNRGFDSSGAEIRDAAVAPDR
jgi:peptide/nickel transport system ATP-binding protein